MNFRYRLAQFMSGRYGTDNFFSGLLFIAAILAFLNLFLRLSAIQILVYGLIIYAFFRVLSRNFEARRKENNFYLRKTEKLRQKIDIYKQRSADKSHVYKKCPKCKAVLRLPRREGKHKTVCPRCSKEFVVRVGKNIF